jgi:putative ABC transport system ATP-binding protein
MAKDYRALLQLDRVSKIFLTDEVETHALSDISLQIMDGEFVTISGPSGCGKSTLLTILGLLDTVSAGFYFLQGQAVSTLSRAERAAIRNRHIGFIFQSFNLLPEMTVSENVALPLTLRQMPSSEREDRVQMALERVGMTNRARHYPRQLSGGQQQRVAVARAVAGGPSLVLADEPTGNLDSANGAAVIELLQAINSAGSTICMVTHDPRYAEFASRKIDLLDGRLTS